MKKTVYLIGVVFIVSICNIKAQQLNNSGFEDWDNLSTASEEPTSWNSFKTASGPLSTFGAQQVIRSAVIRPGSSGSYSALIWSKLVVTVIANGNISTGQVNMGNMTPSNQDNYNVTHTANSDFSEALGAFPDSLVFWVKFVPANSGGSDQARMSSIIHDTYDYRDPTGSDPGGANHVVATAELNFPTTNGLWTRESIVFTYTGPASSPDYILISFTTNMTPGAGTAGDSLYIDDLELIYNDTTGINSHEENMFTVYNDPDAQQLVIDTKFPESMKTVFAVYDITGRMIMKTEKEAGRSREYLPTAGIVKGIYLVSVIRSDGSRFTRKISLF